MAVFEDNELLHVAVIPVGSGHITNDLAIGLRTEIETAENVKIKHVDASPKRISSRDEGNIKAKTLSGEFIVVSRSEVNAIASARLEELFELVDDELKKVNRDGMLPGGVFLSGGGAKLTNINEYAKQALRLPAQVGQPQGFSGVVDKVTDPIYSTAVGLMMENLTGVEEGLKGSDLVHRFTTTLTNSVKNLFHRSHK